MSKKVGFLAPVLFVTLSFVWGSSFILMKKAMISFSWDEVAAARMVISGLCLTPLLLLNRRLPNRKTTLWLIVSGLLGSAIPAFLFTKAEVVVDSATAGVLNALSPLFTFAIGISLFGFLFVPKKLFGVLIGFAGAVLLIYSNSGAEFDLAGQTGHLLLVVLATFCYGFNGNIIKHFLSHLKPIEISAWSLIFAGIPAAFYLPFTNFFPAISQHAEGGLSFVYVILLAVVGTAFALVMFNKLIMLTEPVLASAVAYLIPVVAIAWGYADGEELRMLDVVALAVIFLGLYLVSSIKPKAVSA